MSTQRPDSEENDPVWDLLDQSPPTKVSPTFAQDTLRQVRQLESAPAPPWWKKLLAPAPLAAGGLAVAAAITIMAILPDPSSESGTIADNEVITPATSNELDEEFQQELLIAAAEEPELFSDAELLAMLY